MIKLEGEIRNSYRSGRGDVWIIFDGASGWITGAEPEQLVLSKEDAMKILDIKFGNWNIEQLNHRKITVLIQI